MVENYNTIIDKYQYEIVEKKSRFICNIIPINDEEEAKDVLEDIKKKYYDARHNCFAYIVGLNNTIERYSDDGEPSGTAGLPILEVLRGNNLKNVLAVVTRYFGGTLLGTGGLVRAYSRSTKECLENSKIYTKELLEKVTLEIDYNFLGKVENELHNSNQIVKDVIYTDKIKMTVMLKKEYSEGITKKLVEITNGQCNIESEGFYYEIVD